MDWSELNLELHGTVGDDWLEDAVVYGGEEDDDDDDETERASRSRQRIWGERVRRFESGAGPDPWHDDDDDDDDDPGNWVVAVDGNRIKYNNKLYSKLEYNNTKRQLTCYKGDNVETVYRLRFVECD